MASMLKHSLYGLAVFVIGGWIFVWIMHLMAIFNGKRKLYKKCELNAGSETPLPGVSIIKPLVGIDPNLFSNLESFFTMNYPQFELLFCIHDDKDAAIMFVNRLIDKYPEVDAKLFIGGSKVGVNPKINNMQPGYEAAKYDLILISDSGIRMKEDTLLDMVSSMTEEVALVHQMPFVCDRKGFPSVLEKVYFGTAHARIYLSADFLRINCPTGMSALMRKKLLDEVGGISAFGQYLAEDFFFAKSFTDRLETPDQFTACVAELLHSRHRFIPAQDHQAFEGKLIRGWAKLRIAMIPHMILLEPLSECLMLGVLAAWALNFLFQFDPIAVYLFHMLLWFLLDYVLLCIVQNGSIPFSKTDYVVAWMLRECCALILFIRALWEPDIKWRTGTFKLKWGGIAEEVKTKL